MKLDKFKQAYLEAALRTEVDETDQPLNDFYTASDFSSEALATVIMDCGIFQQWAKGMIEDRLSEAGHDFWLTRNGHGAGFWDGDWPERGDELTELSLSKDKFGEINLYVGDDGKLYFA